MSQKPCQRLRVELEEFKSLKKDFDLAMEESKETKNTDELFELSSLIKNKRRTLRELVDKLIPNYDRGHYFIDIEGNRRYWKL